MARVTVEDCLDKVPTRYDLIILAAKRARQLAVGGRRATLEWQNDKATVMALREIEAGSVTSDNINELVIKQVHGSGGYGMLIGPTATKKDIFI